VAELEKLPIELHKKILDSHPAFKTGEAFDLENRTHNLKLNKFLWQDMK
jgi:hypothetical protein